MVVLFYWSFLFFWVLDCLHFTSEHKKTPEFVTKVTKTGDSENFFTNKLILQLRVQPKQKTCRLFFYGIQRFRLSVQK